MSHIYCMEKMHMAVFNLVGPGSMKSRLANAVNHHLLHLSIDTDIPKDLEDDYNQIMHSLNQDNNLQKRIENLSELEAEKYAQKIVCLFEKTAHLVH